MSGRRLQSYRSGDWNEELGILLLKKIAAVASVPRPEDFGLDAIATLLREDSLEKLLYAEKTFYVQFKSESTNSIAYSDHELEWLKNLQLPLFIGVVRKGESRLDLYPATELNHFLLFGDFKTLNVRPCEQGKQVRERGATHCDVFLGAPLLSFNIEQASNSSYRQCAYRMLKEYLEMEQHNVTGRPLNFCRRIEWLTNKKVLPWAGYAVALRSKLQKDNLCAACESLVPGLKVAEVYASATADRELTKTLSAFVERLRTILTTRESFGENGDAWISWEDPFEFFDKR